MIAPDEELTQWLRRAMGGPADPGLERDLWPEMLQRLDRAPIRALHVPWWDWALAAALLLCLLLFPEAIPAVLYQL